MRELEEDACNSEKKRKNVTQLGQAKRRKDEGIDFLEPIIQKFDDR